MTRGWQLLGLLGSAVAIHAGCAQSTGPSRIRGDADTGLDATARLDGASLDAAHLPLDVGTGADLGVGTDTASCSGTLCGARCVDLQSDPANCGGCGHTCLVPNGTASCRAGLCEVAACDAAFADCDGSADNGCERASCSAGASCATACGTGTVACTSACDASCAPPAEVCNLVDDDCDGRCDPGLPGCRVAVHRSNGPNGHFYTTSASEAVCCGMHIETSNYFYLQQTPAEGADPFFRCITPDGHHFYTTNSGCEGATNEFQVGLIVRDARCGAVPLYRVRHTNGDQLYTVSSVERDSAIGMGYSLVGTVGYVFTAP